MEAAPATIFYIHGPGALKPVSVSVIGDNIQWTYNITVQAGQTVRLGYFTIVATTRAAATAAADVLVTPSGFGGQAAMSLTTGELQSLVNYINTNQAPVLTPASPALGTTDENTTFTSDIGGAFVNNGTGSTIITDADSGAVVGGIALTGTTGRGIWSYSLDGTTFYSVGSISASSALLLPGTAQFGYTPDMQNGETSNITYRAWDQTYGTPGTKVSTVANGGATTFSSNTDTASLSVTDVNDAPVLTPASPRIGSTTEDAALDVSLWGTFVNNGPAASIITDVDSGAVLGGLAIVGTTGRGVWSYSLNGTDYKVVSAVSAASALLIPKTSTLRYTPDGSHDETATISYRAWDATSGSPGDKVDTSTNGGVTPFSVLTDTASVFVNDAPVLTQASPVLGETDENTTISFGFYTFINGGDGTTTITDADAGAIVGGIALTGASGNGAWSYSLDGASFSPVGGVSQSSALLLPYTTILRYAPIR